MTMEKLILRVGNFNPPLLGIFKPPLTPREVYNEITVFDDDLSEWSKAHKNMFIEPTIEQIETVRDILEKYPSIIDLKNHYSADPWVIALALQFVSKCCFSGSIANIAPDALCRTT